MKQLRLRRRGFMVVWIIAASVWICQAQRQIETLDRGVLAVKAGNGVYLSWRVLWHEYPDAAYNVYRGAEKLNPVPLTGPTCYTDTEGTAGSAYSVAAVINGIEQEKSAPVNAWGTSFRSIPLNRPAGGTSPDGVNYTYNANDLSVGDLDGDGEYEIVLKWDPTNSHDNAHSGYTGNVYLDAYRMDGTRLWRIDMGINIRAGAHYTQFMVYDLDGDGKAEMACKTADGTRDGTGTVIGNPSADYRNTSGRILSGPEFLTIFNGETGAAMVTTDYIPPRGSVLSWGDDYGNRVDRFLACVAYLDGQRPSLVMCRGYYTRTVLAAWDWRDSSLTSRWVFDTNNGYPDYEGQGNHNISVADVDEDGKDEIIYGAMAVDDDGTGLWNTGLHHGDAMHVSDIDPNRPGLEKWGIHEGSGTGSALLDARTGEIIWKTAPADVGRGVSADLTAAWLGMECWGGTIGLRSATGQYAGDSPGSSNFLVWWDGDELRELLDGITVSKYGTGSLFTAYNCSSNNGTKATPGLSADLLGDWREEIIFRTTDNQSLRLYVNPEPTERSLFTLMHDPQYRLSIAWQNVAYNQPPHTGFFLGHGMADPPPPPVVQAKLRWHEGTAWDLASENWISGDIMTSFRDGDDVLFDLNGSGEHPISITGDRTPSAVSVVSPVDFTLEGPGSLAGAMELMKAGSGSLTLNSDHDYTGKTRVWGGELHVNGNLSQSSIEVYNGAVVAGTGTMGAGIVLHSGASLEVGAGQASADTLRITDLLVAEGNSVICFDLSADSSGNTTPNDLILVEGDLKLSATMILDIHPLEDSLQQGSYTLIRYTGNLTGPLDSIVCRGLEAIPFRLTDSGDAIQLEVIKLRGPSSVIWQGGSPNQWDMAGQKNWLNGGVADWFIPNDTVLFDDSGIQNNHVTLVGPLHIGRMVVDASGDYTLEGSGVITGPGGLVKRGEGLLSLAGEHQFTGPVTIEGGVLEVPGLRNGGKPSPVGASTADPSNLVLDGALLRITGYSMGSDRGMTIGKDGATLNLAFPAADLLLSGTITGTGLFTKSGPGDLTLSGYSDWSGGFIIENGAVNLGTEEANLGGLGTGKVTLKNATLRMLDDRNTYTDDCGWNLVVPQGSESWLRLDSRCTLNGSLEGGGILNVEIPYIRSEIRGDWSVFTGRIRAVTGMDDAWFLVGGQHGFAGAAIRLSEGVTMLYRPSEDAMIAVGELSGTENSGLGAGGEGSHSITWRVGGLGTHAEFHGVISDRQFKNSGSFTSIVKTGTGNWTLTGANTYSGPTEILEGILTISSTAGSATGSGDVSVRTGGALRGSGSISGRLLVEEQASVSIGTGSDLAVLTVNNDAEFLDGSYLSVKLDPVEKTADKLVVTGHLKLRGILYVNKAVPGSFVQNETYRILEAGSVSGAFDMILPATPGEGLEWDTTWLASYGLLRVAAEGTIGWDSPENSLQATIFPNPGSGKIEIAVAVGQVHHEEVWLECYDQRGSQIGREMMASDGPGFAVTLDVEQWDPGVYLFVVRAGHRTATLPFIRQ